MSDPAHETAVCLFDVKQAKMPQIDGLCCPSGEELTVRRLFYDLLDEVTWLKS